LLAALVGRLPFRLLRALGAPIAWLAGSVLRIRRRHVEASMRRAGVADPPHMARAMYRSLGTGLLELLWMAGRRGGKLDELVVLGTEARARLSGIGGGVIVATAHTGNWDFCACAAAERLAPGLVVLTKRLSVGALDRFWQVLREGRGVELAFARSHAYGALAGALAKKRSVALMIDQAPDRPTSVAMLPFAGAPAAYDKLPAILSARTGAPIVLVLGRRRPDGLHEIDVPLVLVPPPKSTRAWIAEATARLAGELDLFVRKYPDQWLWLHRRWKTACPVPLTGLEPPS
jgi:Kdo2-lipid IVA lauroyltransferase/acyltransferase